MSTETRLEALSQAVRVSLAKGGNESDEDTVKRAESFASFIVTQPAAAEK